MKRKKIYYATNIVLTLIFFIVGILGIFIFPGFLKFFGVNINSLPKVQIYKVHNWLGVLLIILLFIHTKLYWKWIVGMSKRFFIRSKSKKIKSIKKTTNYIICVFLLVSYCFLIITGILKFPGFLAALGINLLSVPINEISLIHDWSGIVAVFLSIVHLILHFNWLKSTTKSLFFSVKSILF